MRFFKWLFGFVLVCFVLGSVEAKVERLRGMWRDDPATTMVIGWDQVSGHSPVFYYDLTNHHMAIEAYAHYRAPDKVVQAKGMNNHFVRLSNLQPNTVYHFVIADSEGCSETFSFQTAPDDLDTRISIIAGGDSRNNRTARRHANLLVSKLRPNAVMFAGDMTGGDTAPQWIAWFDDWQYTIGSDNRVFPVMVARGNHELSNRVIEDLFDVPHKDVYYALTLGGSLLRVYTLNSMIPPAGPQRQWLRADLIENQDISWKFAQYHHSMRPHVTAKAPRNDLVLNWATLFFRFGVELVIESDIHVVKMTHPIRPSLDAESEQGFIRDDENGTVYVGEGCWGAPLRTINNNKDWTLASGSFNQFKWIFVDRDHVELRTVKIDNALDVDEIDHDNRFEVPYGLQLWNQPPGGVLELHKSQRVEYEVTGVFAIENFNAKRQNDLVTLTWNTINEPDNMVFVIERSTDGEIYEPFETLDGKGANLRNEYDYVDDSEEAQLQQFMRYRINPKLRTRTVKTEEKPKEIVRSKPPPPDTERHGQRTGRRHPFGHPRQGGGMDGHRPRPKDPVRVEPKAFGENQDQGEHTQRTNLAGVLEFDYELNRPSDVVVELTKFSRQNFMLETMILNDQQPGVHTKKLNMRKYDDGKYLVKVMADDRVIKRFIVSKMSVKN